MKTSRLRVALVALLGITFAVVLFAPSAQAGGKCEKFRDHSGHVPAGWTATFIEDGVEYGPYVGPTYVSPKEASWKNKTWDKAIKCKTETTTTTAPTTTVPEEESTTTTVPVSTTVPDPTTTSSTLPESSTTTTVGSTTTSSLPVTTTTVPITSTTSTPNTSTVPDVLGENAVYTECDMLSVEGYGHIVVAVNEVIIHDDTHADLFQWSWLLDNPFSWSVSFDGVEQTGIEEHCTPTTTLASSISSPEAPSDPATPDPETLPMTGLPVHVWAILGLTLVGSGGFLVRRFSDG